MSKMVGHNGRPVLHRVLSPVFKMMSKMVLTKQMAEQLSVDIKATSGRKKTSQSSIVLSSALDPGS